MCLNECLFEHLFDCLCLNECLFEHLFDCLCLNECLFKHLFKWLCLSELHWSSKLEILKFEILKLNFKGQGEQHHYNVQMVTLFMFEI
jgi:hypothetical protein